MAEPIVQNGTEGERLTLTPAAYREATQIRANAVVLSRPPLFVPGAEALRLEGVVSRVVQPNIVQVQTDLGQLTVRYAAGAQTANGVQGVPNAGTRLVLTMSPSGTSVRAEAAPLPPADPMPAMAQRPAVTLAQTVATRIAQAGTIGPAFSAQNAAAPRPPTEAQSMAYKPLSRLEGSVVGAMRGGELWFQGNFTQAREGGMPGTIQDSTAIRAFADASQLRHADPAQQIVTSFRGATQPYHTMIEAMMLMNPAVAASLLGRMPRANSSFGIGLMFFFLCLRHGGVRRWLGDAALREFKLENMEEMLDYLDEQIMPKMRDVPGYGKWAVAIAPFLLDEVQQFVWAVQEAISGHRTRLPVHRFVLQLPFAQLGPVQFSGHLIGQNVDILCLTPRPLPQPLELSITAHVPEILETHHLTGGIAFSYDAGLWIPFIENLSLDSSV